MARWAAVPLSLVVGGVTVASAVNYSDERNFVVGFAAAGFGYLTHLLRLGVAASVARPHLPR